MEPAGRGDGLPIGRAGFDAPLRARESALRRRTARPRRPRPDARNAAEIIARLATYLGESDRDFIHAVFVRGVPLAELARATRQRPRVTSRRLKRLLDHIRRPEFAFVAAHHESWPPMRRHASALVLLQRRSRAEAARILRTSLWTLRLELDAVAILIDQARAMGRLPTTGLMSSGHHPPRRSLRDPERGGS